MRQNVTLGTYIKVQEFLSKQKEPVTATFIRDRLKKDYLSVLLCLKRMLQDKMIKQTDNTYEIRRDKSWK